MERETLKQLIIRWKETNDLLCGEIANKEIYNTRAEKIKRKTRVSQLQRKVDYLRDRIKNHGEGSLIIITWLEWTSQKQGLKYRVKKELLLINTNIEDSKVYFDFCMENRKDSIIFDSLEFKEILAGISNEKQL